MQILPFPASGITPQLHRQRFHKTHPKVIKLTRLPRSLRQLLPPENVRPEQISLTSANDVNVKLRDDIADGCYIQLVDIRFTGNKSSHGVHVLAQEAALPFRHPMDLYAVRFRNENKPQKVTTTVESDVGPVQAQHLDGVRQQPWMNFEH